MRIFSKFFLVLICLICFSTFVNAGPIRIISGTVGLRTIRISGAGISYDLTHASDFVFTFSTPYQPGTTISPTINAFTSDGVNGTSDYAGRATINGTTYIGYFPGAFGSPSSNMTFNLLEGINLPSEFPAIIPGSSNTVLSVNIPFRMTGYLAGRNCVIDRDCFDIPGQQIYGNGTATINFAEHSGTYRMNSYSYAFSSSPEPTPEPVTLFLLGTGLAGVFGYTRCKRKRTGERA